MANPLRAVIDAARTITDKVLVAYSGGKDSAVTLDLCCKAFPEVQAFFMYLVPGLAFQEAALSWAEQRYGITIHRIPHFLVSEFQRRGVLHQADETVPIVDAAQVYDYMRSQTGIFWIAGGERIADSTVRRAMIIKRGTIDSQRGRIYPIAHWRKRHVLDYVRQHGLMLTKEVTSLGFSFRSLMPADMAAIKRHFPADYERIKAYYPLVEAVVKRYEFYGK